MANYNVSKQGAQGKQLAIPGGLSIGAQGSLQTITLSGLNANGYTSVNLFNEPDPFHVKKYEVFEVSDDIITLSVVWQRMRKERQANTTPVMTMPSNILDSVLFKNITPRDIEKANNIRDYYSKKLMMWTLNEIKLSSFREDLKKLITSDGKVFQENMKPLAYRLPEFYDYDVEFDEMFRGYNTQLDKEQPKHVTVSKQLSLIKTFMRKRRHSTIIEYWFADENNNLNLMHFSKDNVLLPLLDLYTKSKFKIDAIFSKKIIDNREYCIVEKFKFF